MDDVRKIIYGVVAGFVIFVGFWLSIVYVSACGFTLSCNQGQALVIRTPIPTLLPATLPIPDHSQPVAALNKCQVAAVNLIGAWVSAKYPENDKFTFTDINGKICEATFKQDVQQLFIESNIWYPGSLACASCHQPDLTKAIMNMNLSTYAGIVAGSHRANGQAKGNDILGGGNWQQSVLYQMLYAPNGKTLVGRPPMPFGRGADVPADGPVIYAGTPTGGTSAVSAVGTPAAPAGTPTPTGPEVARPSNPGGAGLALTLAGDASLGKQIFSADCERCHGPEGKGGVANSGSTDGTVPPLNPIDETIANPDYLTFAYNVDLFVEHGSTPEGNNPVFSMPAWGDKGDLKPQQIADVIAYVISLNEPNAVPPIKTNSPIPDGIARPSNPGGAGQAITLKGNVDSGSQLFTQNCVRCHAAEGKGGVANPGSTDGTVPPLNPIDDTIKSPNAVAFAYNIDLFVEHGSTPEGPGPQFSMPNWGDSGAMTSQQIADVIAYVMSLNP